MVNKGLRDNVKCAFAYGKKKPGYYPPALDGYDYNPEYDRYMKKCKMYQVRNTKGRCIGRKNKPNSGTGNDLASKAMKLHHRDKISLKEAWKRVRFGAPPALVDHEWNPKTGRYIKKCTAGKIRNPDTGRCISDKTKSVKTKSVKIVNNNIPDDKEINPLTGRLVKKCAPGSTRNPSTGKCVKNSGPKTPKTPSAPRASTKFNGYKVQISMAPEGVDEFINLEGRNRGHNLTQLTNYYTDMAQVLTRVYNIKNIKITKKLNADPLMAAGGIIVLKYDHADADEDEVNSGIQMVEDLGRDGRNPIQTNGNGTIININQIMPFQNNMTHVSPNVLGIEKTKKGK